MSKRQPSETLNNQLLATIERQRRIICGLLIKNQALRARLMHGEASAGGPPMGEDLKRPFATTVQHVRIGAMPSHRESNTYVTHSAQ